MSRTEVVKPELLLFLQKQGYETGWRYTLAVFAGSNCLQKVARGSVVQLAKNTVLTPLYQRKNDISS